MMSDTRVWLQLPMITDRESCEAARIVCWDPTNEQGLLDIAAEDCELIVSAIRRGDGRYHLTAEAFCTQDGGSDGWYAFLEGYSYNRDGIPAGTPGVTWEGFTGQGYGWAFDNVEDAISWGTHWAVACLGAVRKYTARCKPSRAGLPAESS